MWSKGFPFSTAEVSDGLNMNEEEVRLYILSGDLKEFSLPSAAEGSAAGYHRYVDVLNFISKRDLELSDVCKDYSFEDFFSIFCSIPNLESMMRSTLRDGLRIEWLDRELCNTIREKMSKNEAFEFPFDNYHSIASIFLKNISLSYHNFSRIYFAIIAKKKMS